MIESQGENLVFRITKKPPSETGVKNRVICHRFSMALYFHDQCQNDSKTQHVLSGKWWVFTDKLLNPNVCTEKGRFYGQVVFLPVLSVERRTLRTGFLMSAERS